MSAAQFLITSTVPVLLRWGGPALTVVNQSSAAPIYLNDTSGIDAYRLGPAQAISWDATKPLYAYVDPSTSAVLALSSDAGALFSPVAVAAP